MESPLLPLFPLDVVLFPDTPLPLHVFEPRYKEMIGECLERKLLFGVVRAKENALAEIGCTAEIVAVTKKYEDGKLDIVTEGRRRFQIRNVNHERSFLQGEVVYFEDEPGTKKSVDVERAVKLHVQIMELLAAEAGAIWKRPPFSSSKIAPKTLGESKTGKHSQSTEPLRPTRATVCRSPTTP